MRSKNSKVVATNDPLSPVSTAGQFPRELTAENSGDGFLYRGSSSPAASTSKSNRGRNRFQRKPPHLDMMREYEAAGKSYKAARATIATLSVRHRQLQVAQEEAYLRDQQSRKFTANFAETRLATCGVPTLNTMNVRIDRQREQAKTKDTLPKKPITNKKQKEAAHKEHLDTLVRAAVRRTYGTQELDLKALELVHVPRAAVFTTLLMQLARSIRTVNLSRNSLRELPDAFVCAFPEVETWLCKENSLARLPSRVFSELKYLRVLNVSGNELDALPTSLPDTLETLDVSRNRLHEIHNLHSLTQLVMLDLSNNHFQLLPCGLVTLSKLQTLSLSGNRLVSLATRPQLIYRRQLEEDNKPQDDDESGEDTEDTEAARKKWRVEVDPVTRETVYYNLKSKSVTRTKPKCFQIHVPQLQLPGSQSQQPKKDNRSLLERFPEGWEIVLPAPTDVSTEIKFVNHCTDEIFTTLPAVLDRLGDVGHLHVLILSNNELLELPPSFGKLKRLKRLEAENNKLLNLPDTLYGMQALETVKLGMNGLTSLPPSFSKLSNLSELDVKLNRLRELPDGLGDLKQLRVLDASANALEKLPRSFLALRRIVTLRLAGNAPLLSAGFTVETLRTGDLAQVRWQLEHQLECEKHGGSRPPEPHSRLVGIGAECWSTDLHVRREIARAVEIARKTLTLSLHWREIEVPELPPAFFTELSGLRELRLSGQRFEVLSADFGSFTQLRLLKLRQNCIRKIAPEVFGSLPNTEATPQDNGATSQGISANLEDLDLRYNRLEALPDTFANCTKLKVLRSSHNALVSLPESLVGLGSLTELQLAHNQLTTAPRALSVLHGLEQLDLSFNRIETLDTDFSQLSELQILRLSGNRLTELPMSLGGVNVTGESKPPPIRELTFAGNMIKEFPRAILKLGATLQRLEMQSNRLERLPISFGVELPELTNVESDGNPFRSPPAEIMRLGAKTIREYLHKREQRVEELVALLAALGLTFDRGTFDRPIMRHLLPPGPLPKLPFLTAKHLEVFDRVIDSYVNGAFYLPPPPLGRGPLFRRGADIMQELLLSTHFELAQRHHRTVLDELLQLITLIREKRWADKTDLRYDMARPWGRGGELVGVYMVRGSLLFPDEYKSPDDRPPDSSGRELPSILRVIQTRTHRGFPPVPFIENKRTLRDVDRALEDYVGHYGPVGVVHSSVPMRCACEELLQFGKMHDPCEQRGWTMVRVLYTQEEAARRELDETRLREAQDALLPQIQAFLDTPEGEKRFHREVKLAKDSLRTNLRSLKKQLKHHQAKLKPLEKAKALKQKAAKIEQRAAEKAAKSKNPDTTVPLRNQETLGELKARLAKDDKLQFATDRVREDIEELERGKARLGQGHAAFREEVERVLLEKVGVSVRQQLVRQQRDKANAMGWRRPWDGIDGRAFKRYQQQILRHAEAAENGLGAAASSEKVPKSVLKSKFKEKTSDPPKAESFPPDDEENDDDGVASDNNSEVSDVSFNGYDDLVTNLAPGIGEGNDDSDDDDEAAAVAEAARAAAMAALEAEEAEQAANDLDDISIDDDDDEKLLKSEDSDL